MSEEIRKVRTIERNFYSPFFIALLEKEAAPEKVGYKVSIEGLIEKDL